VRSCSLKMASRALPRLQAFRGKSRPRQEDYSAAVAALNSLQTNSAILEELRNKGLTNLPSLPEFRGWMLKAGLVSSDLDKLNLIHVAGTKGKGSTSAFVSSILGSYIKHRKPTKPTKIGLFTSPHLRFVRERIQVDNKPISEDLFARYFFAVWDKLSNVGKGEKPIYFRYLTIMAFHVFLRESVDTAIIECGIGGEYDGTNIIQAPTVTGITALGIDHVKLLGQNLHEIAWHKAGIFKKGAIALTVPQPRDAMNVLTERADEKGVQLTVVETHPDILNGKVGIGLAGDYQKSNASLALVMASQHLRTLGHLDVPDLIKEPSATILPEFQEGLKNISWPGRSDIRKDGRSNTTWFIDGAHTVESIQLSVNWFADEVERRKSRCCTLIFNQQKRDAIHLLQVLHKTLAARTLHPKFHHAIFTTNVTYRESGYKPDLISINTDAAKVQIMDVQNNLAKAWRDLDPVTEVIICRTIEDSIQSARELGLSSDEKDENLVLVIGSLHLVGGVLDVIETTNAQ
jgi:folylpolyglutamate synthase